jgi:hypothetical protein
MIRLAGIASAFQKPLKEQEEGFDYNYFKGQVDSLSTTLMEFEQELSTNLETIADDPAAMGSVSAGQARNQASRYIIGAERQLENLSKMLDRLERKGEF